jgi:antiviral helicase SLH1
LQSIVFPIAYKSNENMLVCAPTGAGKTDVAMLTVLRVLSIYGNIKPSPGQLRVTNANFKVVYVAPMKALAAEVVRKLSKRLAWLGVQVRELTGDMQLTRREIDQTHIIVTTPEKWAVVTNKPGLSGSLAAVSS